MVTTWKIFSEGATAGISPYAPEELAENAQYIKVAYLTGAG